MNLKKKAKFSVSCYSQPLLNDIVDLAELNATAIAYFKEHVQTFSNNLPWN